MLRLGTTVFHLKIVLKVRIFWQNCLFVKHINKNVKNITKQQIICKKFRISDKEVLIVFDVKWGE